MNWARAGIFFAGVLLAHGASVRKPEPAPPSGGAVDAIASARGRLRQASAALGEDHPVTAFMLCNLAVVMQQAGFSNYAEHYAHQSLAILQRRFGEHDVSLVPSLNVLTEAAVSQGRLPEAREFAARAVSLGPNADAHYGTALHNLAAVFHSEGNLRDAAEFYRRALSVRTEFLPPGHPYIGLTRAALEQVEHQVGRPARAIARDLRK